MSKSGSKSETFFSKRDKDNQVVTNSYPVLNSQKTYFEKTKPHQHSGSVKLFRNSKKN
jgi:hypothetical protein